MSDNGQSLVSDPIALASIGSVILSLYLYYLRGNKQQGIFVGLWAPTFLAFGNYLRGVDETENLEEVV
jgi:hypothetical protein